MALNSPTRPLSVSNSVLRLSGIFAAVSGDTLVIKSMMTPGRMHTVGMRMYPSRRKAKARMAIERRDKVSFFGRPEAGPEPIALMAF